MADKKLKIALCAGVAAVVILMILLLTTCSGSKDPEPTLPVQTQQVTEPTQVPETEPPTEAPTAPTEGTEPATEPTEPEETQGSTGGSSTPGGYTPKETEPFDAPAAGAKDNPYVEVLSNDTQEISTVSLKEKESVYYEIYGASDAVLLLEAADVTLTVGETVCQPDEDGLIAVTVTAQNSPVVLQLTNSGAAEKAYRFRIAERGSAANPEKLESIASIAVQLAEGDEDGYHYIWTATDTCELTLKPAKTGYRIQATHGGITVSNADSADGALVLNVYRGLAVNLQVIAAADEEGSLPAVSDVITGTIPEKGSLKNPIELESLTPPALELAGGEDYIRYYSWTAEMSGTFAVQVTGAEPETVVCGVTLIPEVEPETPEEENPETTAQTVQTLETAASMEVEAGDRVLIRMETAPDESGTYPAAKISFVCTFTAKAGLEANPIVLHVPEDTMSIPAGNMLYYKAEAPGMEMTVAGDNLRIYVGGIAYDPVDGKTVISCGSEASIVFAVANLGTEDAVYVVTFAESDSEPDSTEPDPTEPDSTEPDSTEPVSTEPDSTEPDATEPDSTEPDSTEPDSTEPDSTEPDSMEPDSTEPDATEPDSTKPESTEPEETVAQTEDNPGATDS